MLKKIQNPKISKISKIFKNSIFPKFLNSVKIPIFPRFQKIPNNLNFSNIFYNTFVSETIFDVLHDWFMDYSLI